MCVYVMTLHVESFVGMALCSHNVWDRRRKRERDDRQDKAYLAKTDNFLPLSFVQLLYFLGLRFGEMNVAVGEVITTRPSGRSPRVVEVGPKKK